jgi:choline dehydrogenase-like flavoprotein
VKLLSTASLRRLETSKDGSSIVAAHALNLSDKTELVLRANRYVVAMGGVETPRMLLLSADGGAHREGLGNQGGQLGQHFSDHLNPYLTYDVGRPVGSRLGFETMVSEHFRVEVNRRESPTFLIFSSPAMDWFPVGIEATAWATEGNTLRLDSLRQGIPRMATLSGMTELEGQGTLELDPEKTDAFGAPLAKVTMELTEWDRRAPAMLGELSVKIGEVMGASHVSPITPPEFGLGYHPSGATAMANSPDDGVCDPDLKVFGLNNLYVVSNSVFPHMGANPPTLTIAALALRLAATLEGKT